MRLLPGLLTVFSRCRILTSANFQTTSPNFSSKEMLKGASKRKMIIRQNKPTLNVWSGINISELSKLTGRPVKNIIQAINSGLLGSYRVNASTELEDRNFLTNLLSLLGHRSNFIVKPGIKHSIDTFDAKPRPPATLCDCVPRPPVVAIMGHVDHGKTTLLDALRSSRIVDKEFGGITQHLSAFSLSVKEAADAAAKQSLSSLSSSPCSSLTSDSMITFIDTPGHAAFSAMRARGAKMTDIVLLVVAADDGVMLQTIESIKYARESKAQIIVAINKMDKFGASSEHVLQGLATYGVVPESLGGDIQTVEISALKRVNLVALLEAIVAQAEIMQLVAEDKGPAEGIVLECRVEQGIGKVATCLVTRGRIKQGKNSGPLVAGESIGHVRILYNDRGVKVDSVSPGFMATIAGWKDLPPVGSCVLELASDAIANIVVRNRKQERLREKSEFDRIEIDKKMAKYRSQYQAYLQERSTMDLNAARRFAKAHRIAGAGASLLTDDSDDNIPSFPVVIKADVEGSLEAITDMLKTCPNDLCRLQIAASCVGPVTPADVSLAIATGAEIFAFNVPSLPETESLLEGSGKIIHNHNIIYRLAEDVRSQINLRLPSISAEEIIGEATVLQTFEVTIINRGKKRAKVFVGGCRCVKGEIISKPSVFFRVRREDAAPKRPMRKTDGDTDEEKTFQVLVDRAICNSLRVGPKDVDTVTRGVECGLILRLPTLESSEYSESGFFSDWKPDDHICCYRIGQTPQTLDWHIDYHDTT